MRKFKTQFDKRPVKGGVFPGDIREGDGKDPRYDKDEFASNIANRKALQLCAQVKDILNLTMGGLSYEVLQEIYVANVIPAPDSTQLLVIMNTIGDHDIAQAHVEKASGLLRLEVGRGINRKRVPQMRFEIHI